MTAIDVRHGFVSCVILTEIERMRPTSPSPLPAAVAHFEALFGPVDSWQRLAPESEQARATVARVLQLAHCLGVVGATVKSEV